jgi:hypothetical protein
VDALLMWEDLGAHGGGRMSQRRAIGSGLAYWGNGAMTRTAGEEERGCEQSVPQMPPSTRGGAASATHSSIFSRANGDRVFPKGE